MIDNTLFAGYDILINEHNLNLTETVKSDSTNVDSWFSRDKGLHLVGSLIGTTLISNINRNTFNIKNYKNKTISAGVTLSIGCFKEIIDSTQKNNKFSWKDLMADFIGIAIGLVILEID